MVEIFEAQEVGESLLRALGRLVGQLSSTAAAPTAGQLDELVRSDATVLFLAREGEDLVGMLSLVLARLPTGLRARIEDVVVDQPARGRGIGTELTRAALERAHAAGARTVDLTSRPDREAANRLYERMGFQRRETHVYRYRLQGSEEAREEHADHPRQGDSSP